MHHYRIFVGRGRASLTDELGAEDPFALSPVDIVERVSAKGYVPDIRAPRDALWPTVGQVWEVSNQGLTYLVAVSRDAEQISVQEVRADAYEPTE